MNKNPPTLQECVEKAQDAFQVSKRRLDGAVSCVQDIYKIETVTPEQSALALEAEAILRQIAADAAVAHVKIAGIIAQAGLGEVTVRRR